MDDVVLKRVEGRQMYYPKKTALSATTQRMTRSLSPTTHSLSLSSIG